MTIDDQPSRTVAQGLTALNSLGASIPGTVLVSLGGHDAVTDGTATAFATHVRAVLAAAGTGRSVYWLTSPFAAGAAMDAALRQVALSDTHLQLVDLATTVSAHPEWLASDNALSPAGVSGVSDLVLQELGADGTGDATQTVSTQACSDGYGGYGGVPVQDCTFGLPRANPRTCQDAIRWAIAQQDGPAVWYRRCLSFVAHAYGLNYSGVGIDPATGDHSARAFWLESAFQHPGDPNPPAGALVFWDGGDGHVALSAGNGLVVSNDIRGAGTIALVPIAEINSRWNKPYLGWTPPFFPAGG